MEKREYLEREMKSERGEMKKRLWNWGQALELCAWKREELKKLTELWGRQREMPEGRRSREAQGDLKQMAQEYEEGVKKIRLELEEILREKKEIDRLIDQLTTDEKEFVYLRFQKGYGFDYIGMKMHLSRATVFRIQDKVLKKMIEGKS